MPSVKIDPENVPEPYQPPKGEFRYEVDGKRFGRITVRYRVDPEGKPGQYVLADCDCGAVLICPLRSLIRERSISCGCWKSEESSERMKQRNLVQTTITVERRSEPQPCPRCGALVLDLKSHERWHQNIQSVISSLLSKR
jgi:hypothetical protein